MTSRDFVYWLQGYFELAEADHRDELNAAQVEIVRRHLALVFTHEIDPGMGDDEHQSKLNKLHGGSAVETTKQQPNPPPGGVLYRC